MYNTEIGTNIQIDKILIDLNTSSSMVSLSPFAKSFVNEGANEEVNKPNTESMIKGI